MRFITFIFRNIWGHIFVFFLALICFPPCIIIAAMPERIRFDNRVYYWFVDLFYRGVLFATGLKIRIHGAEHLPDSPAVFIANHQSSMDIPLLGQLVHGYPHVWLFLKQFAHVPVFGFVARRMNVIVDHSGLRKLVGSLNNAIDLVKDKKRHIMLFPEGGRFVGRVNGFFYGFAMIAKELQRPVIPVVLLNIGKAYPPRTFFVYDYPIDIIIGEPFLISPDETEEAFVARVHSWFVAQTSGDTKE